jgi:hypothetical protein
MANTMVTKLNRLLIKAEMDVERLTKENQILKGAIDQACAIFCDTFIDDGKAASEMFSIINKTKFKN